MFHGEIRKKLFRKNYFKLLIFGLLTPLFVSFCSATWSDATNEGYTLYGNYDYDYFNYFTLNNRIYFQLSGYGEYCLSFSGFSSSKGSATNLIFNYNYGFCSTDCPTDVYSLANVSFVKSSSVYRSSSLQFGIRNNSNTIAYGNVSNLGDNYFCFSAPLIAGDISLNWISMPVPGNNFSLSSIQLYYKSYNLSSSCDYSEYESTISTLSGSLATCQNSLSQCQASNCDTQLSQCIIDRDNLSSSVSSLSGSLASCNEDKTSLQNYNNSLSSQLNECLLGSGDNLTGESCFNYSMFWQDSDSNYSLPITNNLFLPNGYKGKLDDDNVLSIAKINSLEAAYQFSEEDKVTIIDILSIVMLFLLATGSLIGLIVFLKRLVINRK